jgi:hypothetical protein
MGELGDDQVAAIRKLHDSGLLVWQIAFKLKVSRHLVRRALGYE